MLTQDVSERCHATRSLSCDQLILNSLHINGWQLRPRVVRHKSCKAGYHGQQPKRGTHSRPRCQLHVKPSHTSPLVNSGVASEPQVDCATLDPSVQVFHHGREATISSKQCRSARPRQERGRSWPCGHPTGRRNRRAGQPRRGAGQVRGKAREFRGPRYARRPSE